MGVPPQSLPPGEESEKNRPSGMCDLVRGGCCQAMHLRGTARSRVTDVQEGFSGAGWYPGDAGDWWSGRILSEEETEGRMMSRSAWR